jgi:hypothetical protein
VTSNVSYDHAKTARMTWLHAGEMREPDERREREREEGLLDGKMSHYNSAFLSSQKRPSAAMGTHANTIHGICLDVLVFATKYVASVLPSSCSVPPYRLSIGKK